MELSIISVENIKPSLPFHQLNPFKLCLLDQLHPPKYSPLILIYPINDPHLSKTGHISSQLKTSLSHTLNPFYPISGRVQENNLFVSDYDRGVPFTETRISGCLSDFLRDPHLPSLNEFLTCEPFAVLPGLPALPQLAVQANIFDCGGIVLGLSLLHKMFDGITVRAFLKSWAANSNGAYNRVIHPNLSEASSLFPPLQSLPPSDVSMENFWFRKQRCVVRRFVFDSNAMTKLRSRAKSPIVESPTRVEALSAFIWKSATEASRSISNSSKTWSVLNQSMNIRGIAKPRLSRHGIGNLFWTAFTKVVNMTEMEIPDLVMVLKEGQERVDSDFVNALNGEKVWNELTEIVKAHPEVFSFSSWTSLGFDDVDFGWGKPAWVGVYGEASRTNPCCPNMVILKQAPGDRGGMEAWLTLDEQVISVLESDAEFLAFASPNPSIL